MASAIIYTRVSTEDQVKGLSLTSQEEACKDYALRNGYAVKHVFREEGASARTTDRKQLIALLDYCKKNKGNIDTLIVWKIDRFARKTEDHLTLKAYLNRFGVSLCSVTEPIEDSNTGRLMETILAGFAQFDNEVRTERAVNGLIGRSDEGGWITRAPLGFINTRDEARRPTLAHDPAVAPIIRKVFDEFATGKYNANSINKYAYEIGLRSRAGRKLTEKLMARLLRKHAYKGYVRNKRTGEYIRGLHQAIVEEETFEAVQHILDGKSKPIRAEKDNFWPLRGGFLTCADCGSPITGARNKGKTKYYAKYACPRCRKSITGKPTSIDRDKLHADFIKFLQDIAPRPKHIIMFRRIVLRQWQDEFKEMADEKRAVENSLQALDRKRERVIELLIDGSLEKDEKDAQIERIDAERTILRIKHSELEQDVDDKEDVIEKAVDFMTNVASYWETAPLLTQRKFQNHVFPDGIIYDFEKGFRTPKIGKSYLLVKNSDSKMTYGWPKGEDLELSWPSFKVELLSIYNTMKEYRELATQ